MSTIHAERLFAPTFPARVAPCGMMHTFALKGSVTHVLITGTICGVSRKRRIQLRDVATSDAGRRGSGGRRRQSGRSSGGRSRGGLTGYKGVCHA